jgi:hypothetical protein
MCHFLCEYDSIGALTMQAFYYKSKILTGTLTITAFTYRCQTNIDWYTHHYSFYLQMPNKYWLVHSPFKLLLTDAKQILTGTLTIQAFTYRCQTNIGWYTHHSSFYLQMPNKYWLVHSPFKLLLTDLCQTNIDWYTHHSSFYLQMPNKYWLVVDVFLPHTQFLSNTCLS